MLIRILIYSLLLFLTACKSSPDSGDPIPVNFDSKLKFEIGTKYFFGFLNINSSKELLLTVNNNTNKLAENIGLSNLNSPYAFAGGTYPGESGTCADKLFSGDSCQLHIYFEPTSIGQATNELSLNYDLGGTAENTIFNLNGYGAILASLDFQDGASFDFGSLASGNTVEHTFVIENMGPFDASEIEANLALPFVFKGGSYPGSGGTCGQTLMSSSTCSIIIEFSPTSDGLYTQNLDLSFNNSKNLEISSIELEGNATSIIAPSAISDLASDSQNVNAISLVWTAPNDNGTAISDYEIEYKLSSSSSWLTFSDGVSTDTNSNVTGLNASSSYDFRLRAFNGAYSNHSNILSISTGDPPDAINNLSIVGASTNQISLGWTAPNDNGTAISDYEIEYKLSASSTWSAFNDGVSSDTNANVNGLSESTSYDFRIRAYNGAFSAFSNIATGETTVDDPFFDPTVYKAMNLGEATESAVVAFEDGTSIERNGSALVSLNAGETHVFTSGANDILSADKAIFVAGRKGSGSDDKKGNMVWNSPNWAGKTFAFTGTRDAPHRVSIYAFEDSNITVTKAGANVDSAFVTSGNNHTFSINSNGSFVMQSDGLIIAHMHSSAGGDVVDPRPILPAAKDIIGFPSSSLRLGSLSNSNNYNAYHSNSVSSSGSLDAGNEISISPEGTSSLYQSHSLRIIADENVFGNSNADSDGLCSAPFVPVVMMKKRFALNVEAEWVAFASTQAGTITIIAPDGSETSISLEKTGSEANAPYKAPRLGVTAAGTRFESDTKFQTWYEPRSDSGGSAKDESLMFGFN